MDNIRSVGMRNICKKITSDLDIDMSKMTALDFFAREGDWQTSTLSDYVLELEAWEVKEKHREKLIQNLPDNSIIRIGDSFKLSLDEQYKNKFDIIVFDNPAGCYGEKPYCEHFEALDFVQRLIKKDFGIVIFNVKLSPFNFDKFPLWKQRREKYYGLPDTSSLELSDIKTFYKNKFTEMNFDVNFFFVEHRLQQADLYSFVVGLGERE
tara:strand:- start:2330 stop:2956 length:627 start_codon:yes stop_codon:yes gene_type:complete